MPVIVYDKNGKEHKINHPVDAMEQLSRGLYFATKEEALGQPLVDNIDSTEGELPFDSKSTVPIQTAKGKPPETAATAVVASDTGPSIATELMKPEAKAKKGNRTKE